MSERNSSLDTMPIAHNSEHWMDNGTGLTNFQEEDSPLFLEAVKQHGDKRFVVSSTRMLGRGREGDGGSLHYLGPMRCNESNKACSAFWRTFYEVKSRYGR